MIGPIWRTLHFDPYRLADSRNDLDQLFPFGNLQGGDGGKGKGNRKPEVGNVWKHLDPTNPFKKTFSAENIISMKNVGISRNK